MEALRSSIQWLPCQEEEDDDRVFLAYVNNSGDERHEVNILERGPICISIRLWL